MLEKQYHNFAYFLTLTYDDEHLPKNGSLTKRDLQLFWKMWRRGTHGHRAENLVYYASGEYGDSTQRCHYHAIVYLDNELTDLIELKRSRNGDPLYTSQAINETWGRGFVVIGEVTTLSCDYVARYVMKKQTGDGKEIYDKLGWIPPFVTMSNGITKADLPNLEKYLKYDEINLPGGRTDRTGKFFMKHLSDIDYERYCSIKDERRLRAIINTDTVLKKTGHTLAEYNEIKAAEREQRYKALKREDI